MPDEWTWFRFSDRKNGQYLPAQMPQEEPHAKAELSADGNWATLYKTEDDGQGGRRTVPVAVWVRQRTRVESTWREGADQPPG